jgi:hypothetical protein
MDRIGKDPLLTKDTEQLLDREFHQIKEEIIPKVDHKENQK